MPERSIEHQLAELTKVVFELKGAVESKKTHDTPCDDITALESKHSKDIAELHNQHKNHIEKYHSSRSVSANWGLIFTGICSLATLATLVYIIAKG